MRGYSESSTRKLLTKAGAAIATRKRHKTAAIFVCLAAVIALFTLGLFVGAANIAPHKVLGWILGREKSMTINNIMLYIRLPRCIASLLCGTALALSGVLLQSALHNPLASAGTIGVNSGAGLFVVLASVMFPGVFAAKPVFAFIGAMFAAFLVYGVSQKARASKSTLIMAGIAVGSLLSAGTDAIVTLYPESVIDRAAFFIGGFSHLTSKPIMYVMPFMAAGLVGAMLLSARMNILVLGDEVAASLGLNVNRCRVLIIFCAALLAACAVCIGGLLGFVGLIAPHAARFIIGREHRTLVPFTALLGGGLVSGCDILARMLFAPYELPVGILLSTLGAPFFLVLILRRRRVSL